MVYHGAGKVDVDGSWHSCARWGRFGMTCPFADEKEHDRERPDEKVPRPVLNLAVARSRAQRDMRQQSVLAEAEEIVSRAAEAIPLVPAVPEGAGRPLPAPVYRSIGQALRERGPVAVGTGVAAGLAIRAVARGFAGGGLHFPQVFDARRALRVR